MPARDIIIDLDPWKILIGVLLVGFAFFVYRKTFPPIPQVRRLLLATLRAFAFLSLVVFALDPAIVETSAERIRPTVLALLDCSRSMSIDDCGGMSRIDCALGAVEDIRETLAGINDTELIVVPFAGARQAEGEDSAPQADGEGGAPQADGEGTDIVAALLEAEKSHRHLNLAGIVLLSDGRITRGMLEPDVELGVPVFAVGLGDTVGPPDVKIDDLHFDRVAYTGSEAAIEAVVGASGHQGREIVVRLLDGNDELDRKMVTMGEEGEKRSVELRFRPAGPGMKRLTVEIPPIPGEEWAGNNTEIAGIRVLEERIRILYVDRFADWNTTFLRDLVRRSERFEMTVVTWSKDRGYIELPGYGPYEFSEQSGAFDRYDLLAISDDGRLLSDPGITGEIARYVEGGGALMLIADEHSPLAVPGGVDGLVGILPVVQGGSPHIETGEYYVKAGRGETDHPLASSFSGFEPPPLPGRIAGIELSSAANVPLVMTDRRGSYPFLAIQRSGEGTAAAVLGFPLWRWKLTGAETPGAYDALLGGLVQYLVEGERELPIQLTTARSAYRMGEKIVLDLVVRKGMDLGIVRGEIRSVRDGDDIIETHLYQVNGEGYASARVGPLPPGDYRAVVSTSAVDGSGHEASTLFTVLPVSTEFIEVSRDMDLLRHLAKISGGLAVEAGEAKVVADILDLDTVIRERKQTIELREARFCCSRRFSFSRRSGC